VQIRYTAVFVGEGAGGVSPKGEYMNAPGVTSPRTIPHFVDRREPTISSACECDSQDSNCACPNTSTTNNPPQGGEGDEKKYRWVFLVVTLPFIIFAGLAYAVKWFKNRSVNGTGGGGAAGGSGPQDPSTGRPPETDPPAIALRGSLADWFEFQRGNESPSIRPVPWQDGSRLRRFPYIPQPVDEEEDPQIDNARWRNRTGRTGVPRGRGEIRNPDIRRGTEDNNAAEITALDDEITAADDVAWEYETGDDTMICGLEVYEGLEDCDNEDSMAAPPPYLETMGQTIALP